MKKLKKRKKKSKQKGREGRPCLICKKPHKTPTKSCPSCRAKLKMYGTSISVVVYLQKKYPDPWKFIEENPRDFWKEAGTRQDRLLAKAMVEPMERETTYADTFLLDADVPYYVREIIRRNKDREFVKLSGNRMNPRIHYICKRCGEKHSALVANFSEGHGCPALKSSGEAVVEDYLKTKGFRVATQYETLKCINPKTGRQLPYDIEVVGERILIEVQGNQHFEYTPHFHGSEENFERQLERDRIKKKFAKDRNYTLLEIDYNSIETGSYKETINRALQLNL